ncbi:MAG: hypothetical protein PF569_09135 [Candidatus Woesearchaeota archaeon]|jgi:hypothetical protein|nr:hypothetical protein [Candidatus Woesearchaeota archaeon]
MTTLQKIKETVEKHTEGRVLINETYECFLEIIDLCDQNPKLRTWDDLTQEEQLGRYRYDYENIINIATKPKEEVVWVYWNDGCKVVNICPGWSDDYGKKSDWKYIYKVEASMFKGLGIYVKDWIKAVEEGEIYNGNEEN